MKYQVYKVLSQQYIVFAFQEFHDLQCVTRVSMFTWFDLDNDWSIEAEVQALQYIQINAFDVDTQYNSCVCLKAIQNIIDVDCIHCDLPLNTKCTHFPSFHMLFTSA